MSHVVFFAIGAVLFLGAALFPNQPPKWQCDLAPRLMLAYISLVHVLVAYLLYYR